MRLPRLWPVLLAAVLGGCGADPYAGETPENAIHVFLVDEMKGFDPAFADEEISNACCQNIYDTLYEYQYLKRPFELVPCLADGMPEVSDDSLTYTVHLKKGARFIDDPCFTATGGKGREVTAQDVLFCFKRLQDALVASTGSWTLDDVKGIEAFHEATKEGPKYRTEYPDVEGLQAPDDHTVVITLGKPAPWFPWILAMAYESIYPREAVGYYEIDLPNHAVTSGPYVVKEFSRSHRLVVLRNPDYRDDRYPSEGAPGDEARGFLQDAGKRLPLNDRVVATVFKETQPMWLSFQQGYLDRTGIAKDNFSLAIDEATQTLRGDLKARGVVLDKDPRLEIIYDCFNMTDPVLGAPAGEKGRAIRRAMSLASDDAWATHNLYNDRVVSVQGPLLEEFDGYDPKFRNPWKPQPGESRAHVVERAKKVLADAGYPDGRGVPELVYEMQDTSTDRQFYEAFARDMRDIGLRVRPNQVSWQELMKRIDNREAQIWGISWGADYPDAQNFFQLFYGPNAPSPNASNYSNPEYDRLYEEAIRLPAGERRRELYRKMQQIVVNDCVWNFRYRRINYNLSQRWFHNFKYDDLYLKYWKYCRSDAADRREATHDWNRPVYGPVWAFAGFCLLLFGISVVATRRRRTAW